MDLEKGPLINIIVFIAKEGTYLFIRIHHLVIDGLSWQILIEDFSMGYEQYLQSKELVLNPKTASFMEWSEQLNTYGETIYVDETAYWLNILQQANEGLLLGKSKTNIGIVKVGRLKVDFDVEITQALLYKSAKAYNTQTIDILLTALGLAVYCLTGQSILAIALEGHGRTSLNNICVDRTIGWFTNIYPVIIHTEDDIKESLIGNKEMLRQIPNSGIGYGLIRKKHIEYEENSVFDICFNYHGIEPKAKKAGKNVILMNESCYEDKIPIQNGITHNIVINGVIDGGKLSYDILFREGIIKRDFVERFAKMLHNSLHNVIIHCIRQVKSFNTVSDFGILDIDTSDFEVLNEFITDIL